METSYEIVWTYNPTFFLVYLGFSSLSAFAVISYMGRSWHDVTIKEFFVAIYFFVAWPFIFPIIMMLFFVGLLARKKKFKG